MIKMRLIDSEKEVIDYSYEKGAEDLPDIF